MAEVRVVTPEEALLERKLGIVQQANCKDLFDEMKANDAEMNKVETDTAKITQSLQAARVEADESADLLALSIEGKNEAERKAKRIQMLRSDNEYQDIQSQIRIMEASAAENRDRMESLRRNSKRIELQIKYRIAILEAIR